MDYHFDGDIQNGALKNSATGQYDADLILLGSSRFDYHDHVFGAASLYLEAGATATLPPVSFPSNGISVAFWIKTPPATEYSVLPQSVFEFGRGYSVSQFVFMLNQGPVYGGLATVPGYLFHKNPIYDGKWHFVICTLSESYYYYSYAFVSYYVDGQHVYSVSVSIPYSANIVRSYNYLGRSDYYPGYTYSGKIDEFRVYDGVLNDADIAYLYASPSEPTPETPSNSETNNDNKSSSSLSAGVIVSIVVPIVAFIFFLILGIIRAAQLNQVRSVIPQQQQHQGITYPNLNSAAGSVQMSNYPQPNPPFGYGGTSYPATSLGTAPFAMSSYQPQAQQGGTTTNSRVGPPLSTSNVYNGTNRANMIDYGQVPIQSSLLNYSSVPTGTSTFPQYQSPNAALPWSPSGATTTTTSAVGASNPFGQSSIAPSVAGGGKNELDKMVESFFNPQPVVHSNANGDHGYDLK
jgi:hypothetical protein